MWVQGESLEAGNKARVVQIHVQPAEVTGAKDGKARHAWPEQMKKDRKTCLACKKIFLHSRAMRIYACVTSLAGLRQLQLLLIPLT